ncbi:MAG: transposase [Oscillospiraceae bacterium]|jgi:putative transposase|nr:hypothetical protein [Bacillota bacterium]
MMKLPQRKLQRLKGFDYASANCYFVTICTYEKRCIFGKPGQLNLFGQIAKKELCGIPGHFQSVTVDKFIVMQNHLHAMIILDSAEAERSRPFPTLSSIIGLYKSGGSREIHRIQPELLVWQPSFHDHIIRGEEDYLRIWEYIDENPAKWELDRYYTKG